MESGFEDATDKKYQNNRTKNANLKWQKYFCLNFTI